MRFFSRIVFICNTCFIIAVIMRWVEGSRRMQGNYNGAIGFQPLEATLVILGYGAIIINCIFILYTIAIFFIGKINPAPRWIVLFNLLIFPAQVYYHFFLR